MSQYVTKDDLNQSIRDAIQLLSKELETKIGQTVRREVMESENRLREFKKSQTDRVLDVLKL